MMIPIENSNFIQQNYFMHLFHKYAVHVDRQKSFKVTFSFGCIYSKAENII